MNPMQALLTLLGHAERERDAAAAEAQRAALEHEAAQRQVENLLAYRRDYEQRWGEQFGRSGGIDIVHCYQGFIARLGQAIEQQRRAVLHAAQRSARAETLRCQQEMRVASVKKLIERRTRESQRVNDRREQKHTDEQATHAAWRRPPGSLLLSAV